MGAPNIFKASYSKYYVYFSPPQSSLGGAIRNRIVPICSLHVKLRQCKHGELSWPAAVSRPDFRARLALIGSRVNSLQSSENCQGVATGRNFGVSLSRHAEGGEVGKVRQRGEKIRGGAMTLVGWAAATFGDLSTTGKCRLGCVIGLTSFTLRGPRHIIQWTSRYSRKSARSIQ